jgi:hypothetical protein
MTTTFDIPMDERTTISVKVNTFKPDGHPRDILDGYVEWNATQNGIVKISKNTDEGTLVMGDVLESGEIHWFTIPLLPENTVLEADVEYGTAVIYHHEARITLDAKEYLAIRGRMMIMPSQT